MDKASFRLNTSEHLFRTLIEGAPVGTCVYLGRELRIEIANKVVLGYWGRDASIIGKTLKEAIPELAGQAFLGLLDDVFTSGNTYEKKGARVEFIKNRKKGTYYFDVIYQPLKDGDNNVYGIQAISIDVTHQIEAQQALAESENYARTLFHNSPIAKLVYAGENMVLKEVNEKMLDIFGLDASVVGKPLLEVMPQLKDSIWIEHYRDVRETGTTISRLGERVELIRNGRHYVEYYDYTFKALCSSEGNIYGVMCTAIDVTASVISRKELEDAEAYMRSAVELAQLGTWSIDAATNCLTYSPRLIEWFGYDPAAQLYDQVIPIIVQEDQQRIADAVAWALNPASGGVYDETYTIIHPETGKRRILHAYGKTIFDLSGKAIRMDGTAQDITMQRELQLALETEVNERTAELAAANEELQSANSELEILNRSLAHSNEELAQYAYVASHDLQEPLRKIRLFAAVVIESNALPEELKKPVTKISQAASRMSLLINDLLEFSRLLNSERLYQEVDLNFLVSAVTTDFEVLIDEKKAIVKVGKMPAIQAISLQMNQLFYNLLGNALKFSASGTPPVIELLSKKATREEVANKIDKPIANAQYYHITITDNGIGFDAEYSEGIFEVFKRLHSRETYSGSGIGLALCRRIVANHCGVLYAESEVGRGSTFHLFLPDRQ